MTFSTDGQQIATATYGNDSTIQLRTLKGEVIKQWIGEGFQVQSISFSPDGKAIVTGDTEGVIRLWNLNGKLVRKWNEVEGSIKNISFSPDGQQIATSSSGVIRLWNLNGKLIRELYTGQDFIAGISFIADSQQIAMVYFDGAARVWTIEDLEQMLKRGCEWLQDYLTYNPYVSDEERQLCGINSPIK